MPLRDPEEGDRGHEGEDWRPGGRNHGARQEARGSDGAAEGGQRVALTPRGRKMGVEKDIKMIDDMVVNLRVGHTTDDEKKKYA